MGEKQLYILPLEAIKSSKQAYWAGYVDKTRLNTDALGLASIYYKEIIAFPLPVRYIVMLNLQEAWLVFLS